MASKKKAASKTGATLKVQYFRSAIGTSEKHKLIIKSLGFKRLNQVVNREDTFAIRGMVAQAPHLVRIIE
jgi:large subunit ribosomal protein L30